MNPHPNAIDFRRARRAQIRHLLLWALAGAFWLARARAQNFDYYVFTLSWSPEFCHENPSNHSDECGANAKGTFIVHGLWPTNNNGSDPRDCPIQLYDRSAIPRELAGIMPSAIYRHEWEKHGVCSGMSERDYFQKIAGLYRQLVIPIQNAGEDQHIAPSSLRRQFAQANPGWPPSAFSIQDKRGSLVAVRVCLSSSFAPISCPHRGDTRNTPITIRGRP
jgi:ribonuclease T2